MNIFYLHKNPKCCAQQHVDKHVVKMILEYAQLLSTAHRVLDGTESVRMSASGRKQKCFVISDFRDNILYSATHINHPSAIWTRKSKENYIYLWKLLSELCAEYTHRYGKTHKTEGLVHFLAQVPTNIMQGSGFTEPTPAMPEEYKVAGDSIQSYRNYYLGDKRRMFSWKNRRAPSWIV